MDAVCVVAHLRSLAAEPRNRAAIVNDKSCLAGLILLVGHKDVAVVEGAVQVRGAAWCWGTLGCLLLGSVYTEVIPMRREALLCHHVQCCSSHASP